MATHSSILAWRIPWAKEPDGYSPWGHRESDMTGWLILYCGWYFIPGPKLVFFMKSIDGINSV